MEIPHIVSLLDGLELCTSHVRSISTKPLTRAAELCDAVPKGACFSKFSSKIANFWCRLHIFLRLWCEAFTPQRIQKRFKQIQTNFKRLVFFCIEAKFCKKIFVRRAVGSSWRDLQDLHAFAPLRSQYFRKFSSKFFAFFYKFCKNSLFLNYFHWFLLRFW